MLNNAVLNTWGDTLWVTTAATGRRKIDGVFIEAYAKSPVGNQNIERPDPSFSFRKDQYLKIGAIRGDTIRHEDVDYTIISEPEFETGNWCNVLVSQY